MRGRLIFALCLVAGLLASCGWQPARLQEVHPEAVVSYGTAEDAEALVRVEYAPGQHLIVAETAESEEAFKQKCVSYQYETLAREPERYRGELVRFSGTVRQVIERSGGYILRVALAADDSEKADILYAEYAPQEAGQARILEGDEVDLYGYFFGTVTYKTNRGTAVTAPAVLASYIDIVQP